MPSQNSKKAGKYMGELVDGVVLVSFLLLLAIMHALKLLCNYNRKLRKM